MSSSASVRVSVRLRPPVAASPPPAVKIVGSGALTVHDQPYDGFLASVVQGSDQGAAFHAIAAPMLDQLQRGYSCTLMAYGQTGSGKTHTIFGPTGALTETSLAERLDADGVPPAWGLLPRVALALLRSGADCTLHACSLS